MHHPSRRGRIARGLAQRQLQVRALWLFALVWIVIAPWGRSGQWGHAHGCTHVHAHYACMGTAFNLPMTTVTIVEDLGMAAMAGAMLVQLSM